MKSKALRLSLIAAVVACCFVLSGCISHWFEDSTTRLQIENRTGADIVEIDIVSEDGKSIRPWIKDTIKAGEISRVYEDDWVGDFKGRRFCTLILGLKRAGSILNCPVVASTWSLRGILTEPSISNRGSFPAVTPAPSLPRHPEQAQVAKDPVPFFNKSFPRCVHPSRADSFHSTALSGSTHLGQKTIGGSGLQMFLLVRTFTTGKTRYGRRKLL